MDIADLVLFAGVCIIDVSPVCSRDLLQTPDEHPFMHLRFICTILALHNFMYVCIHYVCMWVHTQGESCGLVVEYWICTVEILTV